MLCINWCMHEHAIGTIKISFFRSICGKRSKCPVDHAGKNSYVIYVCSVVFTYLTRAHTGPGIIHAGLESPAAFCLLCELPALPTLAKSASRSLKNTRLWTGRGGGAAIVSLRSGRSHSLPTACWLSRRLSSWNRISLASMAILLSSSDISLPSSRSLIN